MKNNLQKHAAPAILIASALFSATAAWAVSVHQNKLVGQIQPFYDSADCLYFKLDGVNEADPIKTGDPIFAIARNQPGANSAYAALLSAKLSGRTVSVFSRGTLVCGYAAVAELYMD